MNDKNKIIIETKRGKSKKIESPLLEKLTSIFYQDGSIGAVAIKAKLHRNTVASVKKNLSANDETIKKLTKAVALLEREASKK